MLNSAEHEIYPAHKCWFKRAKKCYNLGARGALTKLLSPFVALFSYILIGI